MTTRLMKRRVQRAFCDWIDPDNNEDVRVWFASVDGGKTFIELNRQPYEEDFDDIAELIEGFESKDGRWMKPMVWARRGLEMPVSPKMHVTFLD